MAINNWQLTLQILLFAISYTCNLYRYTLYNMIRSYSLCIHQLIKHESNEQNNTLINVKIYIRSYLYSDSMIYCYSNIEYSTNKICWYRYIARILLCTYYHWNPFLKFLFCMARSNIQSKVCNIQAIVISHDNAQTRAFDTKLTLCLVPKISWNFWLTRQKIAKIIKIVYYEILSHTCSICINYCPNFHSIKFSSKGLIFIESKFCGIINL